MGKGKRQKKRQKSKRIVVILAIILIGMLALLLAIFSASKGRENKSRKIEFPYELNEGKLVVNSLFQSSISNPDCNNEEGEDIASIEITNASEEFLVEAKITVVLKDGTEIPFLVTNLPAGGKIWAFATDNQSMALDFTCTKINSEVEFAKEAPLMEDKLACEVDETNVSLMNKTSEAVSNLVVGCHCLFEGVYYGGLTYSYQIDEIPANDSTAFEADDCYLGSAVVVCIE